MRALIVLFVFLAALAVTAGTKSSHRSETVSNGETRSLSIIKTDDDYFSTWERDGKRYITRDRGVLAEIESALAGQREVSKEHSELGRRHSDLGREHAQLGREHARLGREHARASRIENAEARQRELERLQRELERKQAALERRQEELERMQRDLERKSEYLERDGNKKIDEIFERAIRTGKAKRD